MVEGMLTGKVGGLLREGFAVAVPLTVPVMVALTEAVAEDDVEDEPVADAWDEEAAADVCEDVEARETWRGRGWTSACVTMTSRQRAMPRDECGNMILESVYKCPKVAYRCENGSSLRKRNGSSMRTMRTGSPLDDKKSRCRWKKKNCCTF